LNYRLPISVPTLQVSQKKVKASNQTQGQKEVTFIKNKSSSNLKRSQQKGQQSPDLGLPQAFS
jgi:hypothetical protein